MIKKILGLLIICLVLTATAYALPWEVQIENQPPIAFEVEPQKINGMTYVPLWQFYQALGLEISFDHSRMTVSGQRQGLIIQTKIGSSIAEINGNPVFMRGAPVIINNRTMVPLDFIARTFDYQIIESERLRVIYLRQFVMAVQDVIEANERAAKFNRLDGPPRVEMVLQELSGRKEHYLQAGAFWRETLFLSSASYDSLPENLLEPSRFYVGQSLYLNLVLKNASESDQEEPFFVHIRVKGRDTHREEISSLAAGATYQITGVPVSGLTFGNNIIEVFIDPEKKLNQVDPQDYEYRIIYAYRSR